MLRALLILLTSVAACVPGQTLVVEVDNRTGQPAIVEITDGLVTESPVVDQEVVPPGSRVEVTLARPNEWVLRVNEQEVYDSIEGGEDLLLVVDRDAVDVRPGS